MSDDVTQIPRAVGEQMRGGDIRALDYFPARGDVCPQCTSAKFRRVRSADGYELLQCASCDELYLPSQQNAK